MNFIMIQLHNDLANLHDKEEYVTHIRNLKQALNSRLISENVLEVIKSNQKSLLIWMSTELNKNAKKHF